MKTLVLIPFEPAPKEPDWLIKKHAGKKLDALEMEEYYFFKNEIDHRYLTSGKIGWDGIPSFNTLFNVIHEYHMIKKHCITSMN
jgi:hypothetical protein